MFCMYILHFVCAYSVRFCMRVFGFVCVCLVLYVCVVSYACIRYCMRVLVLYACIRFCVRVFGFVCVFAHLIHPTKDNRSSFRKREIIDHCITGCGSKVS